MSRIAIHYHTDPAARIASGIDSFIRGILRHAPDDLHYTLIGATTDRVARPPGRTMELDLDGRSAGFLPLIDIDSEGRRGVLPLTARYVAALARHRLSGGLRHFDILDFHRIEPLVLFGADARPKNLTLHQDMVVIRDPRSDILWRHAPRLYEALESRLIRRVDRVFCVRRPAVERYRARLPQLATRFSFTPTWFDSSRFSVGSDHARAAARDELRHRHGWRPSARVMIFVGRLDRQKDPLLLLEAALPLLAEDPQLHLLLVGDGGLRLQVEAAIAASGLSMRVALAGARHGEEIATMLRGADLFVMSSAYEGMPIAVLEALASGLPVVSTPVGEVPTLVRNGENGVLATASTAASLQHALRAVLQPGARSPALPLPQRCAASVAAYRPEVVLAAIYDNHRRQASGMDNFGRRGSNMNRSGIKRSGEKIPGIQHPGSHNSREAARADVLGSRINLCGPDAALQMMEQAIDAGQGGYVCFTNAHTVMEGRRDPGFRAITNGSLLSLADGRPVYWVTRWRTRGRAGHAPGPDFFAHALAQRPQRRHFLYGSSPENLAQLRERIRVDFPGAVVCGAFSPPFRPMTDDDRREHARLIRDAGAEFVWVGLGAPKQERWMAQMAAELRPAVLLGVGAAFDFHSGRVRRAPRPMRRLGLEWLHRLGQEPRRLWRRYLVTNSLFLWHLATDRASRANRDVR